MPYKRLLLEFAVQKIICASPCIELSSKDYRILQVKSSPSAEFPSVLPKKKKKSGKYVEVCLSASGDSMRWNHYPEAGVKQNFLDRKQASLCFPV